MIFVTVGTQLPFDRLIQAVDEWAGDQRETNVFAQTGAGTYQPSHISSSEFLGVSDFNSRVENADLLISHAGMGSIITAMENSKPIVLIPRLAKFGEHRNDHQLATVSKFRKLSNVFVAENETELPNVIKQALASQVSYVQDELASRRALISSISSFIGAPEPIPAAQLRRTV